MSIEIAIEYFMLNQNNITLPCTESTGETKD